MRHSSPPFSRSPRSSPSYEHDLPALGDYAIKANSMFFTPPGSRGMPKTPGKPPAAPVAMFAALALVSPILGRNAARIPQSDLVSDLIFSVSREIARRWARQGDDA